MFGFNFVDQRSVGRQHEQRPNDSPNEKPNRDRNHCNKENDSLSPVHAEHAIHDHVDQQNPHDQRQPASNASDGRPTQQLPAQLAQTLGEGSGDFWIGVH